MHTKTKLFGITAMLFGSLGIFLLAFYWFPSIFSRATAPTSTTSLAPQYTPLQHNVAVDNGIENKLKTPTDTQDVLIYLDTPTITNRVTKANRANRDTIRPEFVNELRQKSATIQQSVRSRFASAEEHKHVVVKKTFFINNVIHAQIDNEGLTQLKNTPGILQIIPNSTITLPPMTAVTAATPEWNLDKIHVPQVWSELGIKGSGVTVANIDTGVQWDHPSLKSKYRGWNGTSTDNNYNWFDTTSTSSPTPIDDNGHGTHTMGTMVGSDDTHTFGVAPEAKWIAVRACPNGICSNADLLEAGQWILAPTKVDGTNPDPSKAPDIVSNSWGGPGCQNWFSGVINSWNNAGIFSVFAGGNEGPNPDTIGSPGDNENAFSVGATDISDNAASFSSRGPSCSSFGSKIKPDIAAPGVSILSSIPYNGYTSLNGTSMATPHVAGVAALLLQYKPNLTPYEIRYALQQSATDLGSMGTDNTYGSGLINAYKAIQIVQSPIPTATPLPTPTPIISTATPIPQYPDLWIKSIVKKSNTDPVVTICNKDWGVPTGNWAYSLTNPDTNETASVNTGQPLTHNQCQDFEYYCSLSNLGYNPQVCIWPKITAFADFRNEIVESDETNNSLSVSFITPSPTPLITPTPTPTTPPTPLPTNTSTPTITPFPSVITCSNADINKDGVVNSMDNTLLQSNFFATTPSNPRADINNDNVVDLTDYSILVSKFNTSTGACK